MSANYPEGVYKLTATIGDSCYPAGLDRRQLDMTFIYDRITVATSSASSGNVNLTRRFGRTTVFPMAPTLLGTYYQFPGSMVKGLFLDSNSSACG